MSEYGKCSLLSIIVPVYNGEIYLQNTLESILSIKDQELEVILVDNGSQDGSGRICQEYVQKDRRIRYLTTKKRGIVAARNYGMAAARGSYIGFCDQDDEVMPYIYSKVIDKMEKESAQMGIFSVGRIINGTKSLYESLTDNCCHGDGILEQILYPLLFCGYDYSFFKKDNYLYGTVWKCIFRTDFLKEYQMCFRSFVNYEDDWLFVTEALCHADTVVTESAAGYYWRVNARSKSHQKQFVDQIGERFERLDSYVASYLKCRIPDKKIWEQYQKVQKFEHFVDMFKNEPNDLERRRDYRKEVKNYLIKNDYRKQLGCCRYLQKNVYRKRLIYRSLGSIGIRGTFLISRVLSAAERTVEQVSWLAKWERKKKLEN